MQVDGLQRPARVADEARRGVVERKPGDQAHVFRGEVGHQQPRHRPVDDIDPLDVARAHHHVAPLLGCPAEAHQIVGVVRKVAVHLADEVEAAAQPPLETGQVGRAEPLLAAPLDEVQPLGELLLTAPHDGGRAVGRAVVDDQQLEGLAQREDLVNHCGDVLPLVVGRYDNQFAHGLCGVFRVMRPRRFDRDFTKIAFFCRSGAPRPVFSTLAPESVPGWASASCAPGGLFCVLLLQSGPVLHPGAVRSICPRRRSEVPAHLACPAPPPGGRYGRCSAPSRRISACCSGVVRRDSRILRRLIRKLHAGSPGSPASQAPVRSGSAA